MTQKCSKNIKIIAKMFQNVPKTEKMFQECSVIKNIPKAFQSSKMFLKQEKIRNSGENYQRAKISDFENPNPQITKKSKISNSKEILGLDCLFQRYHFSKTLTLDCLFLSFSNCLKKEISVLDSF